MCVFIHKGKEARNLPPDFMGLLMREFFYTAASNNSYFDKMKGNPVCVQIPWDKNPEAVAKWAEGRTGFPWIDAVMAQLKKEGWISHLARRAVVCFLTRGDLWLSWEEGLKVSINTTRPAAAQPWLTDATLISPHPQPPCSNRKL